MSQISYNRRSANEKNVEELQRDTLFWDKLINTSTQEIQFLIQLISSDVFEVSIPNLFEKLKEYSITLEEIRRDKMDIHNDIINHQNDLNGMLECEDVSCDAFYHDRHQKLADRVHNYLLKFQDLKLEIFKFSIPLLKRNPQE